MHWYHPPEVRDDTFRLLRMAPAEHLADEDGCALPCPRCRQPMVLRYGTEGVYFHCACARFSRRRGGLPGDSGRGSSRAGP